MALILVADDSPTEVFMLKRILEKHKHQIIVAEDGKQAIKLTHNKKPNLIVMDVIMPNSNGFACLGRLSWQTSRSWPPMARI